MEALSHKTRINELISSLGISKNKFAKAIGTSSAMISKVTTQDINYGVDLAGKIISTFPSVNPVWLLTGVGEMMLSDSPLDSPLPLKKEGEKRPQVFISSSHSDLEVVREALLAARTDYKGRPNYYYSPENKIYNYYAALVPDEVEDLINNKLEELLELIVATNMLTEMINERRRGNMNHYEAPYELVTFKEILIQIEEEALGENIAPDTEPHIQRLTYLFEVEAQISNWQFIITGQVKKLQGHGFGRSNAYKAAYGKEYPYGHYPSAKELVARQHELAATFSEEFNGEGAELPGADRD